MLLSYEHGKIKKFLHDDPLTFISTKKLFWLIGDRFSFGRGSFLAFSVAGHAGGGREHYCGSVGPGRAPWRVLRAFKFARELENNDGTVFRDAEHPRTMKTKKHTYTPCYCFITPSLQLSKMSALRQPQYNSSHTSSSSLCDGHRRCFCVCACVPYFLSSYS